MSAGGEGNAAKANPQSVEQQKHTQRPNGEFYRLSPQLKRNIYHPKDFIMKTGEIVHL